MTNGWKVLDLINVTKSFFEKKGIVGAPGRGTARLDAELLLAEVLGCGRIDLYLRFGEAVDEAQLAAFRELVRRRGERQPVKQILGRCEFMSHEFDVSPDVLIPRPETETVVEQTLAVLGDGPGVVADIGTGTGVMALMACRFGARRVVAVEPSPLIHVAARIAAMTAGVELIVGDSPIPFAPNGPQ